MKLFFRFILTFLSISAVVLSTLKAQPLVISSIQKDFYVYTTWQNYQGTPYPANGMYVLTTAGAVLIDCPWDSTQFQALLDSIEVKHSQKVVMAIATHFHADRTAGFDYYRQKGIATWSSAATKKFCIRDNEKVAEFVFDKDTIFTVGDKKIEAFFPGAGHTPDNIVIWFDGHRVLYGGCFVKSTESEGIGNLSDADVKAWPSSINKTISKFKNPKWIIPGHEGWSDNRSLNHTLDLLRSLGLRGQKDLPGMNLLGLIIMAILYIAAGLYHFINPKFYRKIVPPQIPYPSLAVAISGAAEILFGAGLLFENTRMYSAWGIILLLIAVFPSNIYMAVNNKFSRIPLWIRIIRLPLQLVLIYWAWIYT